MSHGIVDVVAYQEALLIEAVFGLVLLTMIWVGFRRWLQHKERISGVIAEQAAQRTAQIDARLAAVEQILTDRVQTPAPIEVTRDQA